MLITLYIQQLNAPKSNSFFGKVDSMFSNVKTKITQGAQQLDQKYDISGKSHSALVSAQLFGEKVVEKGKEISVKK